MLSRVADNLYWMSRYLERAEHTARLVDVHLNLTLDSSVAPEQRWTRVIASLGVTAKPPHGTGAPEFLTFDATGRCSIVSCIAAARENAGQVREQTSSEMWQELNRLFHSVRGPDVEKQWIADPHEFLLQVKARAHLFQGVTDSTMNHDEGWRFIQLGRFIERAGALATLLDAHFRAFPAESETTIGLAEHLEWIGLLRSCTAFEPYCKVYTADLKPERIAEFLLLNDTFPHSVRFAVDRIQTSAQALPEASSRKATTRLTRLTGKLRAALNFGSIDEIIDAGLHPYLDSIRRQCLQIHDAIREAYIDYPVQIAAGA